MSMVGDQLFQFGGVPVASGLGGPILAANENANVYWVHPANPTASDGNDGLSPQTALVSLSRAQTMMTANQNDVAILLGNSSASVTNVVSESSQLVWSKNLTHIIGTAYNRVSHRCSIRQTNGDIANFISVTADGCLFANFHVFSEDATNEAEIAWTETGQRNAHYNLHIAGMGALGSSKPADQAGSRNLKLVGDGERYFEACTLGVDTVVRGAANASLELANAAVRDQFVNCDFLQRSDQTTPVFIDADASSAIDRFTKLRGCLGINHGTKIAEALNVHATAGGWIVLHDTQFLNMTKLEDTASTNVYVEAVDAATSTGRMVVNTG